MHNTKVKDSNSIVSITKHNLTGHNNILLAPDNTLEILQVLNGEISIKILSKAKSFSLHSGRYILIKPRNRGMEVSSSDQATFRIIKIVPINSYQLTEGHEEVSSGIYATEPDNMKVMQLGVSISNLDTSLKEEGPSHRRTLRDSIELIKKTHGHIKIKDLYETLNISKSTLELHFMKEIGLTPKEFCRIEKLNHFIGTYQKGNHETLTELTYKCGYYDQSHLIKDFKYFLDTSPRKFFSANI